MHKIRNSLTEQRRPHTSMSYKHPRESSFAEFIPFTNERDNMGRLIKPIENVPSRQQNNDYQLQAEDKEYLRNGMQSKMEDKMNTYFKQTGLCNLPLQLNKNKIIKKSLINIAFDDPNTRKNINKIHSQNLKDKCPLKTKEMRFTQDSWNKNKGEQKYGGIRRMKSTLIPRSNSCTSPLRINRKSEDLGAMINTRQSSLKVKKSELNLQQYQQLNMYHKRQQLEVKMQANFEEGHLKFIDKMMRSKKLAHEVKYHLDQIDHYY